MRNLGLHQGQVCNLVPRAVASDGIPGSSKEWLSSLFDSLGERDENTSRKLAAKVPQEAASVFGKPRQRRFSHDLFHGEIRSVLGSIPELLP